jgi:hypothetical protein
VVRSALCVAPRDVRAYTVDDADVDDPPDSCAAIGFRRSTRFATGR